jgi:hypothetical protein
VCYDIKVLSDGIFLFVLSVFDTMDLVLGTIPFYNYDVPVKAVIDLSARVFHGGCW